MSVTDRDDWLIERLQNLASDISNGENVDYAEQAADIRMYVSQGDAVSRKGFQSDLALLDEATRFRAIHTLVPEDLTIPGEVWTAFLEQEYQLDHDHPGDVTLSAVVGELLRLMQEAKEE